MSDVFISYTREDREKAKMLALHLANEGMDVFWDRDIPVGSSWDRIIENELELAKTVIVLWSRKSVDSDWVRAEASRGADRKVLIPVIIERTVKIPLRFQTYQAAEIIDWPSPEENTADVKMIIDAVCRLGKLKIRSGSRKIITGKAGSARQQDLENLTYRSQQFPLDTKDQEPLASKIADYSKPTKKLIKRISNAPENTLQYKDARSQIMNGDILLYHGRSIFAGLIEYSTRSYYSHAGLAAWWGDRLLVMELVGGGVMLKLLSHNIAHFSGDVDWYTTREPIPEEDRFKLIQTASHEIGIEYPLWRAIFAGLSMLFMTSTRRDEKRNEVKIYSSRLVLQGYNACGWDLRRDTMDRFLLPDDIALSPKLKCVATLTAKA
jgi:hypothetical protein